MPQTSLVTSVPSPSLPLSQIKLPSIYLGRNGEPLPYGLVRIKGIPQEESHPSTPIHWSGLNFYQAHPLLPLQTPTQTPLPNSFDSPADFLQ